MGPILTCLLQKTAPALLEFCSVALGTSLYLLGGPNDGRCGGGGKSHPRPAWGVSHRGSGTGGMTPKNSALGQ